MYAIRAWKDSQGNNGITISQMWVGEYNAVVEHDLVGDGEIAKFLQAVTESWERSWELLAGQREKSPGPYDDDWEKQSKWPDF